MPRALVITCDRCGAKIAWYPIDGAGINDLWNASLVDGRCFVAHDRERGQTYRDVCPDCAAEVFWIPTIPDTPITNDDP